MLVGCAGAGPSGTGGSGGLGAGGGGGSGGGRGIDRGITDGTHERDLLDTGHSREEPHTLDSPHIGSHSPDNHTSHYSPDDKHTANPVEVPHGHGSKPSTEHEHDPSTENAQHFHEHTDKTPDEKQDPSRAGHEHDKTAHNHSSSSAESPKDPSTTESSTADSSHTHSHFHDNSEHHKHVGHSHGEEQERSLASPTPNIYSGSEDKSQSEWANKTKYLTEVGDFAGKVPGSDAEFVVKFRDSVRELSLEKLEEFANLLKQIKDPSRKCPVTGEDLGSMGPPLGVTVKGQIFLVCCKGCVSAVRDDPDKYLQKEAVQTSKSKKAGDKSLPSTDSVAHRKPQTLCPVTGEKLGSMGKPISVTANGETIQVCCQGCVKSVQRNPQKYISKVHEETHAK